MAVIFKAPDETFAAHEIAWSSKKVTQAIARHMLLNHTAAYIDMMCDGQAEMGTTRDELQASLGGVKPSVEDIADDLLDDFVMAVKQQLKAALYGAIVTGIKYDLAGGIKDVDIDVSVSWE